MTNPKAPREFWIHGSLSSGLEAVPVNKIKPFGPCLHVIEFSAYEKQSAALKIAVEALEQIKKRIGSQDPREVRGGALKAIVLSIREIVEYELSAIKETLGDR